MYWLASMPPRRLVAARPERRVEFGLLDGHAVPCTRAAVPPIGLRIGECPGAGSVAEDTSLMGWSQNQRGERRWKAKGTPSIVLPVPANHDEGRLQLHPGTETFVGSVLDLIDDSEVSHWKDWLGSIQWKGITSRRRLISPRVRWQTGHSERWSMHISPFWSLLLAGRRHGVTETAWQCSGEVGADGRLMAPSTFGPLTRVPLAYYREHSDAYLASLQHGPD